MKTAVKSPDSAKTNIAECVETAQTLNGLISELMGI